MKVNPLHHHRVIIVGGGAAGASVALAAGGTDVLMLDVGLEPTRSNLPDQPLDSIRKQAQCGDDVGTLDAALIGEHFESLLRPCESDLSIKLKGPLTRYVTARPQQLPADEHVNCVSAQSFALGGLANSWGAGAMRYTDLELCHFPFPAAELEQAFDILTRHIGISGSTSDDLAEYFGSTQGLLSELELCELAQRLLKRYERRKGAFQRAGIRLGRPRLAVLPQDYGGRRAFRATGQEFFISPHEGIYSPIFTIKDLIARGSIEYHKGILVERFEQQASRVIVFARDLNSGEQCTFSTDHLVLAAGTINTSRIVLASRDDHSSLLPILDNPISFIPFVDLPRLGVPLPPAQFLGAELTLVLARESDQLPIQGSIYNLMGPLRTDMAKEFPLCFSGNLVAGRYLTPATMMLQLFYPARPHRENYLQLLPNGRLRLVYSAVPDRTAEKILVKMLCRSGYVASTLLCKRPPAGSSIHYAGTLPARVVPQGPYETGSDCRLTWAPRVVVADASTFPVLPAKNHTLMLMANAYRLGRMLS